MDGNVTLRFTDGTERFVPIGQREPVLSLNADGTASMVSVDEVIEYKWWETDMTALTRS